MFQLLMENRCKQNYQKDQESFNSDPRMNFTLFTILLVSYQTHITGYTDRGGAKGTTSGMTKIYPGFQEHFVIPDKNKSSILG